MKNQLPLSLKWADYATFENYVAGNNLEAINFLKEFFVASEHNILLQGGRGVGLTHLLQACCHAFTHQGKTAVYLPLKSQAVRPQMLEGLENLSLICIDDVDTVSQNRIWEEALFHLFNRSTMNKSKIIFSSHSNLQELNWVLPDLKSRLYSGIVFNIKSINDDEKIKAIQQRGKARGLMISQEIGHYLLSRWPRDMNQLFEALTRLDEASLITQRRLTIPFVKTILNCY
jgi:DnaA family protein